MGLGSWYHVNDKNMRKVWRQEPVQNAAPYVGWVEYVVEDQGNSEKAEQTFSTLKGFKITMRSMTSSAAYFFLYYVTQTMNARFADELAKENKNPVPHYGIWSRVVGKSGTPGFFLGT